MAFAFTNEEGLPRIIRYVDPGTLPSQWIVSLYSEKNNLLVVDKDHYERLSDEQRHMLLRTQKKVVEIYYRENRPPTITV